MWQYVVKKSSVRVDKSVRSGVEKSDKRTSLTFASEGKIDCEMAGIEAEPNQRMCRSRCRSCYSINARV